MASSDKKHMQVAHTIFRRSKLQLETCCDKPKGNRRIGGQALIIFYRSIMMIAHTLSKHDLKIGERWDE